jgi:hypothetical protein
VLHGWAGLGDGEVQIEPSFATKKRGIEFLCDGEEGVVVGVSEEEGARWWWAVGVRGRLGDRGRSCGGGQLSHPVAAGEDRSVRSIQGGLW